MFVKAIKFLFKGLVLISLTQFFHLNVQAWTETTVLKSSLPYEIMSIDVTKQGIQITGWAFISYKQHFIDGYDHQVELEFISVNHNFRVLTNYTSISQTAMMTYFGSPTCSLTTINQIPEVCNFNYENVGFTVTIPLNSFHSGETYQTQILVHAKTAQLSYKTPLYYPMPQDQVFLVEGMEYRFVSKLDDTELKIAATTVIARKEPSKTGLTWYYGTNCSTSYLNQLFFIKDSVYKNIYEKRIIDDTSFYRVSANLYLCNTYRRRIIEGLSISPVWIASPYVLYSGSPLNIQVRQLNQAPNLILRDIEITEGDSFNIYDYISAYDPEDGDLTAYIAQVSSNFTNKPGYYQMEFMVTDQMGLSAYGTLNVNVLTKPNFAPIIYAYDKTILQYSIFDPYNDITAYDFEDGDISNLIIVVNQIDTSITNNQIQCYEVSDLKDLKTQKCININVLSYGDYVGRFRFLSIHKPFYLEEIPNNWKALIFILNSIIESNEITKSIVIQ